MKVSNPIPWQILLSIARGKSLSEAADINGVDSARASRLISSLEAELGLPLLDRTTKPVRLSEKAYSLIPRVLEFLDRYDALLQDVRTLAKTDEHRVIRFAVPGNISRRVVIALTDEYRREHPAVIFEIQSGCEHPDILSGRVDIAVLPYCPTDDRLLCLPLSRTTTFLAASPAYLAETGSIKEPEDLVGCRLILRNGINYPRTQFLVSESEVFDFATGMRMTLPLKEAAVLAPYERCAYLGLYVQSQRSRFLSSRGVTDFFYGDAQSCLQAALEGVGICVDVSAGLLKPHLATGSLAVILPQWHRPLWNLTLAMTKRNVLNQALHAFAVWYAERERSNSPERLRQLFGAEGLSPEKILENGF